MCQSDNLHTKWAQGRKSCIVDTWKKSHSKIPALWQLKPIDFTELQDFMFDTMASKEMAVDWYCERFEVSATDDVIDFVLDAHDAFFGN